MKIISTLLLIAIFACTNLLSDETKIVYVDMDKILNQSTAGKQIQKQIEKIRKNNISSYQKIKTQLAEEEKNISKQKNILSKEEFNQKIKDLRNNVIDYKNKVRKNTDELNKMNIEATSKILEILNPILSDYASKNSISIIIQKKNIVIGKSDLEITEKIMKLVNKKITKIKLN